ncbi:MAG: tetratricopeptide repeat protein [Bacteroidales bacterium]|jgi:tetratricopeptide (TPR) repeat protein|nr:tetratricopeptide repeat protein [Bacteroidales bacterium]
MKNRKWIIPLVVLSFLIFVISFRQLSDPDLGFHLKYGKWITNNCQFPTKDLSTYTVADHDYIDLHWFFQVIIYGVYRVTGYSGLSIFFCFLTLMLSLLLILRNHYFKIPLSITCFLLLFSFLIIDPRIAPRPELFSFIFLIVMAFILDLYHETHKNYLYILPVIMLLWCNMHALFVLGLIVQAIYIISQLWHERKMDKTLLIWTGISFLVCFVNPYGAKGFTLPIELLSRFDPGNVYNQHIQEFMPFFAQPRFVVRDYLLLILLVLTIVIVIFTRWRRKAHELLLLLFFSFLAINSIRNIPLFILIVFPILSRALSELRNRFSSLRKEIRMFFYFVMILIPLSLIPRFLTNAWYLTNNSFNKTGMGVNSSHQPVHASDFLLKNHLDGRILNSLGYGGWLSWTIPQSVFMDGRLEVMQESIYNEITESWRGKLSLLVNRYKPELIIYNYLKYYPWTFQLKEMPDWRLIYLDGSAAIFAFRNYATQIPTFDLSLLPAKETHTAPRRLNQWFEGFYAPTDYRYIDDLNKALFRLQMSAILTGKVNVEKAVVYFNRANEKYKDGDIRGAIAGYDSAIFLQPEYAKAYNNRGIIRAFDLKDYAGAKADFDKAIELETGYGDAYLGRGTVLFYLHNTEAACNDWHRARQLGNLHAAHLIELHCKRK